MFSYNHVSMSSVRCGGFLSPMNHKGAIFYPFLQILESLAPYGMTTVYEPSEDQAFDQCCFTD